MYDHVPRLETRDIELIVAEKLRAKRKRKKNHQDTSEHVPGKFKVECAVGLTKEFQILVGLHQGSVLSSFLFADVTEWSDG